VNFLRFDDISSRRSFLVTTVHKKCHTPNDSGLSYRSAIFPVTPEQAQIARETIADVNASGLWPGKVVTWIESAGSFWEAEPVHQDYLERYPNGYTCHFPRAGWVLPPRSVQA
jgi:peptide-methionine (S)-S-oxide reductase